MSTAVLLPADHWLPVAAVLVAVFALAGVFGVGAAQAPGHRHKPRLGSGSRPRSSSSPSPSSPSPSSPSPSGPLRSRLSPTGQPAARFTAARLPFSSVRSGRPSLAGLLDRRSGGGSPLRDRRDRFGFASARQLRVEASVRAARRRVPRRPAPLCQANEQGPLPRRWATRWAAPTRAAPSFGRPGRRHFAWSPRRAKARRSGHWSLSCASTLGLRSRPRQRRTCTN